MKTNIARFFYLLRLFADVAIVHLAFYFGYHTYMGFGFSDKYLAANMRTTVYYMPGQENFYLTLAIVFSLFLVSYNVLRKYYRGDNSILNVKEYQHIISSYLFAAVFTCAFYFVYYIYLNNIEKSFTDKLFSRRIYCYSVAYAFIMVICFRAAMNWLIMKLHKKGVFVRNCLVLGAGNNGKLVSRRLMRHTAHHYLPVCFLDDFIPKGTEIEIEKGGAKLKVEGTVDDLERLIKELDITSVFFCMSEAPAEKIFSVMDTCYSLNVPFYFTPRLYTIPQVIRSYEIAGIFVLSIIHDFGVSWYYNFIKRAFDITLSILLLIPFLPVMLLVALAIKLDSKGPVFFSQERVGLNGRKFIMYKFRSMRTEASGSEVKPKDGRDPRITRVGHFLRLTSLDELPQILNVLKGDMSFVGPRPEMTFIVDTYDKWQRLRLKVKPGITGLWQISAERNLPIHENLDYDMYYLQERSLLLDIVIMFKTFFFIARGI
ncbi:sugar transferase [bacterium]|nr:sugar transferase [bacterium]